jgi:hypothetical protein
MSRNQIAEVHWPATFASPEAAVLAFRTFFAGSLLRLRIEAPTAPAGGSAVFTIYKTPHSTGIESSLLSTSLTAGSHYVDLAIVGQTCADGDLFRVELTSTPSAIGFPLTVMLEASETGADKTDAQLLARANHTGSQLAATISDFAEAVDDEVAGLLQPGALISLNYSDPSNQLTIAFTGTELQARVTYTYTTASLADGATENFTLPMGKSCSLISATTDFASWIRAYGSAAERTADATRLITARPALGAGVFFDGVTSALVLAINTSPAPIIHSHETTPSANVPFALTNKSGAAHAITLTVVAIKLEK